MLHTTFRQMQIFESVARHRSFTRASEELFITQSSVSTQVKQLSSSLNCILVEMVGNKLYLTHPGKAMYRHCQHVLRELKDIENDMASYVDKPQGRICISCTITGQFFLPRVFGGFHKKYPDVDLELKVVSRPEVNQRMTQNKDDLYVISRKCNFADVNHIPFVENPMIVIANPNHPLSKETNVSVSRLLKENFLIREPGSSTLSEIETFIRKNKISFNRHMILGGNEAIKQGVIGGLGISILSRFTSVQELKLGILSELDVSGFPLKGHWYAAYPAGKQPAPVVHTFIDYIQNEGAQIARQCLHGNK